MIYINVLYIYNCKENKIITCLVYTCNYLVFIVYVAVYSFLYKCKVIETILCLVNTFNYPVLMLFAMPNGIHFFSFTIVKKSKPLNVLFIRVTISCLNVILWCIPVFFFHLSWHLTITLPQCYIVMHTCIHFSFTLTFNNYLVSMLYYDARIWTLTVHFWLTTRESNKLVLFTFKNPKRFSYYRVDRIVINRINNIMFCLMCCRLTILYVCFNTVTVKSFNFVGDNFRGIWVFAYTWWCVGFQFQ